MFLFGGQVLDANPAHVKGLYRRGTAYMLGGDFDEAKKDFEMVCFDPYSVIFLKFFLTIAIYLLSILYS